MTNSLPQFIDASGSSKALMKTCQFCKGSILSKSHQVT
ncbi:hypothetical protein R69776_07786 [Paraburkholderia nemoris]|uniref:Uncharacterized protein n=1 Tax=Paraburkholderia nemoris TaxID=2793076 RepID=A0ABM8T4L7_9BURK|nr:hypothetical protein R69776_07786 [Paraburkholderia nemoris]